MNDQNYDKLLDTSLSKLNKELEPPKDLWIGIDRAIELNQSSDRSFKRSVFQTAAVILIVLSSVWLFTTGIYLNNENRSEVNLTMLVEDMNNGFVVQKNNMLSFYEGKDSLTSNWQDQLQELEVARVSITEALKETPDNDYMIQILQNIQQQQLNLIQSVHTQINRSI